VTQRSGPANPTAQPGPSPAEHGTPRRTAQVDLEPPLTRPPSCSDKPPPMTRPTALSREIRFAALPSHPAIPSPLGLGRPQLGHHTAPRNRGPTPSRPCRRSPRRTQGRGRRGLQLPDSHLGPVRNGPAHPRMKHHLRKQLPVAAHLGADRPPGRGEVPAEPQAPDRGLRTLSVQGQHPCPSTSGRRPRVKIQCHRPDPRSGEPPPLACRPLRGGKSSPHPSQGQPETDAAANPPLHAAKEGPAGGRPPRRFTVGGRRFISVPEAGRARRTRGCCGPRVGRKTSPA
jgi:hypothetical protein